MCEAACLGLGHPVCHSFTYHHMDFEKSRYRGHCYARADAFWDPVPQSKIDSGYPGTVAPNGTKSLCSTSADCSGYLGDCVNGTCMCRPGWTGKLCSQVKWKVGSARKAYESESWTWGASPIQDQNGLYHIFSSQITNDCGILHYTSNSQIIHLTSTNPLGPYTFRDVALAPRAPPYWDSGATHGVSVHALPSAVADDKQKYALFYMGANNTWGYNGSHPNCTVHYDKQAGDHATRRIGVATSASLSGPWLRRDQPIFGPGNKSAGEWDFTDESNPTPIIASNGSTVLLYKGRGSTQAVGVAVGDRFDGPFVRSKVIGITSGEDPWGWIDNRTGIYHAFTHDGNGVRSAGGHNWAYPHRDPVNARWRSTGIAYTGQVTWANGTTSVLARRERPQVLFAGEAATGGSIGVPQFVFTSAQVCETRQDGGPGTQGCRSFTMVEEIDLS